MDLTARSTRGLWAKIVRTHVTGEVEGIPRKHDERIQRLKACGCKLEVSWQPPSRLYFNTAMFEKP
jgi:hypothetical protein